MHQSDFSDSWVRIWRQLLGSLLLMPSLSFKLLVNIKCKDVFVFFNFKLEFWLFKLDYLEFKHIVLKSK